MGLIDGEECRKADKLNPEDQCEACALGKMHRSPNRGPITPVGRAPRKGQRIHTDLARGCKTVRTPSGKRYAIIYINDYTDYTWVDLARKKSKFTGILKRFLLMAEGVTAESVEL